MVPAAPGVPPALHPTSGSWLNQVERFFAALTEGRLRRGVFTSVPRLERAIADPKPFVWTKSADDTLASVVASVGRFCQHTLQDDNRQETSNSGH